MATPDELKRAFLEALDDSPFVMLGLAGVRETHTQPMTARFDDASPNRIWFYAQKDNRLIEALTTSQAGVMNYASKGHDLFACVHGSMTLETDPALVDRFWSPTVALWFEKGKDDPDLAMLRFDAGQAEIWRSTTGGFLRHLAAGLVKGSAVDDATRDVAKVHF